MYIQMTIYYNHIYLRMYSSIKRQRSTVQIGDDFCTNLIILLQNLMQTVEWPRLWIWAFQTASGRGTWKEAASFQGLGSSPSSRRDCALGHPVTRWHLGGFASIHSPVCHPRCEEQPCSRFLQKKRFHHVSSGRWPTGGPVYHPHETSWFPNWKHLVRSGEG